MTNTSKEKKKLIYKDLVKALKSPHFKGQKSKTKPDIQLFKNMCEN